MQIEFFKNIESSRIVLIAGVGGGFDIASGMPLYRYLYDLGKEVVLANFSFTDLVATGSVMMSQGLYPLLATPLVPSSLRWNLLVPKLQLGDAYGRNNNKPSYNKSLNKMSNE